MKIFGIVLIVLGILGLIFNQVTFTQEEEIVDFGGLEINREETKSFPIYPVAAGAIIVVGIVLVVVDSKKT